MKDHQRTGQNQTAAEDSMKLHPARKCALDYLRRKGTKAPLESLKQRLRQSFETLEAALDPLDATTARCRPAEGRWSIQEIVDHLTISHQRGAEQFGALLAGRSPGDSIPASLQSKDPMRKSWPEALADLKSLHCDFLALLEEVSEDLPLERTAPAAILLKVPTKDGSMEVLEWIEELDWKAFLLIIPVHNREHQDQIQRTLNALI